MSKYIDADKLNSLIDTKLEDLGMSGSVLVGRSVLCELKDEIKSIQQEQPEVDLEKEIKEKYSRDTSTLKTREQYKKLAIHFYELGLNARKEE